MLVLLSFSHFNLEKQVFHSVRMMTLADMWHLPPLPQQGQVYERWGLILRAQLSGASEIPHKECPCNHSFALWLWSQILFSALILTIPLGDRRDL